MTIIEKTIGTRIHRGLVALVVTVCQCGKRKYKRKSLCPRCFSLLPLELQKRLYLRSGQGYEEAYDDAINHLMKGKVVENIGI